MFNSREVHVIIQAGEEDPRLFPLTSALSGQALAKQFARIAGDQTLLQRTVASYASLVPRERITVVVSTNHENLARNQLRQWRGISILARPLDRGRSGDLLLALGRIVARAPDSVVVVAPAYDYVPGASVLAGSLVAAGLALAASPIVVAGAVMNRLTSGARILVPGPVLDGRVLSVRSLVEGASPVDARRLKASGALWDTGAFTARSMDLWKLVVRKLPLQTAVIESLWAERIVSPEAVAAAFERIPISTLDTAPWQETKDLGVLPIQGSGWNAWNTPEQVLNSLSDLNDLDRILARIYQRQHGITRAQLRRQFDAEARRHRVPERTLHR